MSPVIEFYDPPDGRKFNAVTVSHAEIDAAVSMADGLGWTFRDGAWMALNRLNIKRCEACGGEQEILPAPRFRDTHTEAVPCPDCNGHGWTRAQNTDENGDDLPQIAPNAIDAKPSTGEE